MYETAFCAVCKSVCLMKCNMSRASLNIENIGHITLSTVKSLTIIATFWEEKLVGRPHPNRIKKISSTRKRVCYDYIWEELGKEVSPLIMKEVGNKNGIFWEELGKEVSPLIKKEEIISIPCRHANILTTTS